MVANYVPKYRTHRINEADFPKLDESNIFSQDPECPNSAANTEKRGEKEKNTQKAMRAYSFDRVSPESLFEFRVASSVASKIRRESERGRTRSVNVSSKNSQSSCQITSES